MVPGEMPVTIPVDPTVAIDGFADDHAPPGGVATHVAEAPAQIRLRPVTPPVRVVTVTGNVTKQPVGNVYVSIAAPVPTAVAMPAAFMEMVVGELDDHDPPVVRLV